jgi:predicted DNA-binding transcriptional regulator YafY
VTTQRTARLYELLQLLAAGEQTLAQLTRALRCDVRSFYRDLKLLRDIGFVIPLREQRYGLESDVTDDVAVRLPFPDPALTLAEARQLAVGRTAAHRKLREQIEQITPVRKKTKGRKRG